MGAVVSVAIVGEWVPGHAGAAAGTCRGSLHSLPGTLLLSSMWKPWHKEEREVGALTGSTLTAFQSIPCQSCLSPHQFCSTGHTLTGPFWHCHCKGSLPSSAPAVTASCLEGWSVCWEAQINGQVAAQEEECVTTLVGRTQRKSVWQSRRVSSFNTSSLC